MVTIQDFMNIELKIAKIIEAKDHPNADKLVVIKVDAGETEQKTVMKDYEYGAGNDEPETESVPKLRQIVAGIRGSYKSEDLVGKYIVLVSNLEPATLRGVESQGMLLAASDDEGIAIISPERPVKVGSKVK
jgi:methionyl-tRNA synthetase